MGNTLKAAVAVMILTLLAGALSGCELLKQELTPEEAVAQTRQATESIKTAEFELKMEMSGGGASVLMTGNGTLELPDSFMVSGTMTIGDDKPLAYQQRLVQGKQYVKWSMLGEDWWMLDVPAELDTSLLGSSHPNEYFAYFEVVESTEDLGTQSIRGAECRHLLLEIDEARLAELLESTASPDTKAIMASSTMQVEVWIAEETGLPLREIVDATMELPDATNSGPMHMVAQIDFTAFDTPVEIVAPIDAKPMPVPTQ